MTPGLWARSIAGLFSFALGCQDQDKAPACSGAACSNAGKVSESTVSDACLTVTAKLSPIIPTVGIVEWTTTLPEVKGAYIAFGSGTSLGKIAPVDRTQPGFRSLLLGMKAATTYHLKVVVQSSDVQCVSPELTLTTGTAPNGLIVPTVTGGDQSSLFGGFFISETYRASTNDWAFILDSDGDLVWWYQPKIGDLTATRLSFDAKYLWIAHGNVPQGTARVVRVSLDGTDVQDFSGDFANQNHDLAVLPDETIVYIAYNSRVGCDDIIERSPDGKLRTIVNVGAAFGGAAACHCNAIQYSRDDDTIIVSDDDHSAFVKVTRQGQIRWVLGGGSYNSFDRARGGASSWVGQHNFHVLGPDRILFFNNGVANILNGGMFQSNQPSQILELKLDLAAMTTALVWQYSANPPIANNVMGDVQRLDNGNTLAVYSTQGVVHELDASGNPIQQLSWALPGAIGYATKVKSLYDEPPR